MRKIDKDGREKSPIALGVILMVSITVILAAIIAAFVFGMGPPENIYMKIQTEELDDKNLLLVKVLNYTDNSPFPNATIKILEHGPREELSGPYTTDESGYAQIKIPHGYDEYFDIFVEYKGKKDSITIDNRPLLVKLGDKLGSLGIAIISTIISAIFGIFGIVIGWFLRGRKIKKNPDAD